VIVGLLLSMVYFIEVIIFQYKMYTLNNLPGVIIFLIRGELFMKKDKGFELIYWNLSYRRKFIRTLWMTPTLIILLAVVWGSTFNKILKTIVTVLLISVYLIQLIYTYKKWKSDEI